MEPHEPVPTPQRSWLRRHGERYGLPELVAKAVGLSVTAYAHHRVLAETGSKEYAAVASAYAGSVTETMGFYAVVLPRQIMHDRRKARDAGNAYGLRGLGATLADLCVEFGVAEVMDTLLTRPLCISLGQGIARHLADPKDGDGTLENTVGTLGGMVVADVMFYGWPIIYRDRVRPFLMRRKERRTPRQVPDRTGADTQDGI